MRADYDSAANAISIAITDAPRADASDEVHARAIVAVAQGRPVEVQLLYPDMGSANRSQRWPTATASIEKRSKQPRSPRSRRRRPDLQVLRSAPRLDRNDPATLMLQSERPKVSQANRRPIFTANSSSRRSLPPTSRSAHSSPWRRSPRPHLRALRVTWTDVRVDDLDEAETEFGWQVDRANRRPPRRTAPARTVPIPRDLSHVLARHQSSARCVAADSFVFSTGTGAPAAAAQRGQRAARHSDVPSTPMASLPHIRVEELIRIREQQGDTT